MQNQLETYLQQIEKQLKTLPPEKCKEELREIRQHLETMAAASVEQGETGERALAKAIVQFGNAKKVGRELRKTYGPATEKLPRVLLAGVCTALVHVALVAPTPPCLTFQVWSAIRQNRSLPYIVHELIVMLMNSVDVWPFIVAPFIASRLGSSIAPTRALLGIVALYPFALASGWITYPYLHLSIYPMLPALFTSLCLGALSRREARQWLRNRVSGSWWVDQRQGDKRHA